MKIGLVIIGLLALASPLAAAAAQASPSEAIRGTRLTVTGEGRVTRPPDYLGIVAGVSTETPTAADAIRQNAVKMEAVRTALRSAGIADRDIRTSSLRLQPQWQQAPNQPRLFTGYMVTNELSIRFRDIANAGRAIDALVSAGANEIRGPDPGIDRPEAALDEARSLAVANARARAELYARALGLRIRRVVSVDERGGSDMGMANFANNNSAGFAVDTSIDPGVQALTAEVTIVFELE
jgi:uncharacterized protein YggE